MVTSKVPTTKAATRYFQEGATVCCVTQIGCKSGYRIWQGAKYTAIARKRDGALQWRRTGVYGPTRSGKSPSAKYLRELYAVAPHHWVQVRHNQLLSDTNMSVAEKTDFLDK